MASVEELSDIELRKKLIEYGFEAGPVTGTTRKLMEKKLTVLMSQKGKPIKAAAPKVNRNLSRFSSGEDSDDALVQTANSRRKSMPAPAAVKRKSMGRTARAAEAAAAREAQVADNLLMPSPPPPAAGSTAPSQPARARYSMNEAALRKNTNAAHLSAPTPPRSTRKTIATSSPLKQSRYSGSNGFDSGSDSDVPAPSVSSVRLSPSPRKTIVQDDTSQEDEDEDDKPIATLLSNLSDRFLSSNESSRHSTPELVNDYVKHRMNVGKDYSSVDNPDAPYLSAFARRLSQLKAHPIASSNKSPGSTYDNVKESDASSDDSVQGSNTPNGHYYRRNLAGPSRVPMRRIDPSRSFKTSEETVSFWKNSHVMSLLILGGFVMFAIFLGMLYWNVTNKDSANHLIDESSVGNVYNICKDSPDDVPGVTCVTQSSVAPAMKIFDSVFQNLMIQAVKSECGPTLQDGFYPPPYLTEREAIQAVVQHQGLSIWEAEEQVANLVVLLLSNSHWGVTVKDAIIRHPDKTKLQVSSPKIPWECTLRNKALGMLSSALFILCAFVGVYGVGSAIRWWISARQKHQGEVYYYVGRIIEFLSSQQQSTGESAYVPVIHIRDQLIPPQSREKLKAVWDAAVAFIDKKESRVRSEIQPVNGEDYKVWRWLSPKLNSSVASSAAESPSSSPHPRNRKVWQGQAFGLTEKSPNNLSISPTPCLKIRHMFDPDMESGDNWQLQVQDAILEKCPSAKILHIHVDKSSKEGCVYVKCVSEPDAGKAYKALHGSWFDSQLVTVKYLRLERYHERFPLATKAKEPMRPSNNLKLSLQVPDED